MYQLAIMWEGEKKTKQKSSAVTQNCQTTVALRPKTSGNYTRVGKKKNLLAEVINRKLSIRINKAPTNLWEWHQFPKGHPSSLFTIKHHRIVHLPSEDANEGWVPFRQPASSDSLKSRRVQAHVLLLAADSNKHPRFFSYNCSKDVNL